MAPFFTNLHTMNRVDFTPEAKALMDELRDFHGPLMFHQSGGCCDGSSPMCFPLDEFKVGASDVYLGAVDGAPFYMSASQFEYWKHTHLTLHITPGRGSSFSLEIPTGKRFLIQSRLLSHEEIEALPEPRLGKQH